jgi:hypothetical protein
MDGVPVPRLRLAINPWRREHHVLLTDLSPDECCARLAARTAPRFSREGWPGKWAPNARPLRGTVSRQRFRLIKTLAYRNSWRPEANGRFTPTADGTRIDMSIGQNWAITVFQILVLGAILAYLIAAAASGRLLSDGPVVLLILGMAVGMHCIGHWSTGATRRFLLESVREPLSAVEVPDRDKRQVTM